MVRGRAADGRPQHSSRLSLTTKPLLQVDKGRKDKREEGTDADGPDDSRQLRNQFNFSERAAQTFNYPMVDRGTTTEPPPTASMTGTCNQVNAGCLQG